ncbi:MAG: MFS transporter, partial [Promethearchaeota archaeon]
MIKEKDKRLFIQKHLYTYHFLNDGITFILPVLMTNFFIMFNLTWFQMGLIFAFNSLSTIIFQLIIGYYTDKEGYSEILMKIGLILLALSSFLMIFSHNFTSLLIFAIISGIALAFQHSIAYATTSRMYGENQNVMIGRQGAYGDFGKCVAVFSSALLIIFFTSWRLVLLIWSIVVFL